MRIPRIYTKAVLAPDTTITLEPQASHHLSKVLRCKIGNQVLLFNGCGGQFESTIMSIEKSHLQMQVHGFIDNDCESPLSIHLGIALSRGERMDFIMQKATELGVSEITPLFSERSEVKLKGQRLEKKIGHWQQITISACEQCGRNRLPLLNTPLPLVEWINNIHADKLLVLHHRTNQRLDKHSTVNTAALLIGPEGGLSQTEIERAERRHFNTLSLGPRVLRTETAPLAAITLLQHHWGDM